MLSSFTLNSYAADCRKIYEDKIEATKLHLEDAFNTDMDGSRAQNIYGATTSTSGFFFVGAFVGLASGLTPLGWVILGSAPIILATPLVYNPIVSTPYKRVIKLINQSYSFKANQYQNPGRFLRKSFAHLPTSQDVSIERFADSIIEANETGKLCEGVLKYKQLNKKLNQGAL